MRLLCGSESWVLWEQIRWSCIDPRVATLILSLLRVLIIRHFIVLKLTHLVHYRQRFLCNKRALQMQTYSRCRPIPSVPDSLQVFQMYTYSRCSMPISSFPDIIHIIQTYSRCPRHTAGRLIPDISNLLQVFETLPCVLDLLDVSHLLQIFQT